MRDGAKTIYKSPLGKFVIDKVAQVSLGKAVHGAAAVNHVAKILRSNVVSSVVATTVISAPDFYRAALDRSISWKQFSKNLFVNASGTVAGIGGWMVGATMGAAVGSVVPGIGSVVGGVAGSIVGALGVGAIAPGIAKAAADKFAKDDGEEMVEILKEVSKELAYDYMLSEQEMSKLSEKLNSMVDVKWLREMYKCGKGDHSACREFAYTKIDGICKTIVETRPKIYLPKPEQVQLHIDNFVKNSRLLELSYADVEDK